MLALYRGQVLQVAYELVAIRGHAGEQCAEVAEHTDHCRPIEARPVVTYTELRLFANGHHYSQREIGSLDELETSDFKTAAAQAAHVQREVLEHQKTVE